MQSIRSEQPGKPEEQTSARREDQHLEEADCEGVAQC